MARHRIILLMVLAPGLLLADARGQDLRAVDGGFETVLTHRWPTSGATSILVDRVAGSMTVSSGSPGVVTMEERVRVDGTSRAEAERVVREAAGMSTQTGATIDVTGARLPVRRFMIWTVPPGTRLDVRLAQGPIEVSGMTGAARLSTSAGSVQVRKHSGPLDISSSGGSLLVEDARGSVRATTSGGSIDATRIEGDLEVVTAGGSVQVRDADRRVGVSTAGGSIRVQRVGGAVDLATAGGDIIASEVRGGGRMTTAGGNLELTRIAGMLRASTSGGDVTAEGLTGGADLETLAGDIQVREAGGSLRLRTQYGDVGIQLSETELAPSVDAQTRNGTIDLVMAPGVSARIDAQIRGGGRLTDHDLTSDYPLTREVSGSGTIRSQGTLGSGSGSVTLEANGGSIRIRRYRQ